MLKRCIVIWIASEPFLGPQLSALMTPTGLPNDIKQDPVACSDLNDPHYQWLQNLGLEEDNGHAVYLTKFLADGFDLTSQIGAYLGATYIPPYGSLLAGICWSIVGNLIPRTPNSTSLAPGLIFTVRGTSLGPQFGWEFSVFNSNGRVPNNVQGVQVLVNGFPCPLLYVQAGQINAIAPYGADLVRGILAGPSWWCRQISRRAPSRLC